MTTTTVLTKTDDADRLGAVAAGLIGGEPSPVLDEITALVMRLVGGRGALVNLVADERQGYVSRAGAAVPLLYSYCGHVLSSGEPFVVADAREHPLLRDFPVKAVAYLGVPVRLPDGPIAGTLCVFGDEPRVWSAGDVATMTALATAAGAEIGRRIAEAGAARARQELRWVLDSAADAFIATDLDGNVIGWNRAAEELFGWTAAEVRGCPAADVFVSEEQRPRFMNWLIELTDTRTEGTASGFMGSHRRGRRFPIELSATVREQVTYSFVRDISATRRSERLRRLEYAVSGALAAAQSAEDAADAVVARVGEGLKWPYVEYWHLAPDSTADMVRVTDWSGDLEATAGMRAADACGVVTEVWTAAAARWKTDLPDSGTSRAEAAREAGLNTVVAVPVRNGPDVVGVLAIFDRRVVDPEPELMATLDSVAAHIGQYVHHRRAVDLELRLSRALKH